ncbi:hypothetical protein FDB88_08325 [Clostridium sporogenes]|uniref:Uncharacterized protein n=2 Tax=Clostridium sporogenes TaxID=1509 RepID=A0A7U4XSQ1_CLOSG|nr:hypothetical protein [Clostridium sporogenes]AVP60661.1 hypothetical protein C7M79_08075 [Clostridium botulinum]AKC61095.1 hypothetical protein CLSPO_c03650 [Clostridium sporogenes]AKJ88446.1 hypothetical protein CLSPOx_01825 [Clostridium sporogenes]KCZ69991.1 hypothetical protein CSPO_1c00830 [Clostridium sporogenes]NFM17210.1 hypothetical protein [Clostridium sporogenes]
MLKLSILEFFLISIPETFIFMVGIYFLSKKKFSKKRLIIMALLFAIESYCVRMLPIHFGIHLAINIIFSIIVSVNIGKISIKDAISYNMLMIIILCISEFVSIFVLIKVFKINRSLLSLTPINKVINFIPYFILFAFNVFLINKFMDRRKQCNNI